MLKHTNIINFLYKIPNQKCTINYPETIKQKLLVEQISQNHACIILSTKANSFFLILFWQYWMNETTNKNKVLVWLTYQSYSLDHEKPFRIKLENILFLYRINYKGYFSKKIYWSEWRGSCVTNHIRYW